MPSHLRVTGGDNGGHPGHPPDPTCPTGADLDLSLGAADVCMTPLPYPAPALGAHVVYCSVCGLRITCEAASRADDTRSGKVACRRSPPPAAA